MDLPTAPHPWEPPIGVQANKQMSVDPTAVFGRFLDRQQRSEQFTEDIRKVIHGGGSSIARTRSPGLAAGAALALGAKDATMDARAACRQASERARHRTCPFDDHSAFGASPADIQPRPRDGPPPAPNDARLAHQQALRMGKQNRELQQKVGAGAPFDAPERAVIQSLQADAQAAVLGAECVTNFNEAQMEALRNKGRMRGTSDLISGNYLMGDSGSAPVGRSNNSHLPRGKDVLLPQAHMKLQYDGGSAASLTVQRAEYLNAKVMAESNQYRNQYVSLLR